MVEKQLSISLKPTPEMYDAPINDQTIPLRIWVGMTGNGTPIEAYILSIVPTDETSDLRSELPDFMLPPAHYKIGTDGEG